jgi:hypothetical protein
MPRDLPILFSAPMVLALLREAREPGTGKTQTRRILKPQPDMAKISQPCHPEPRGGCSWVWIARDDFPEYSYATADFKVRFAKGDRLWVRETVACGVCAGGPPSHWAPSFWRREQGTPANPNGLWYAADGLSPAHPITERGRWMPGIHMPRWASRLTLTVTDVRVERVNDISWHDALAEGVVDTGHRDGEPYGHCRVPGMDLTMEHEPETVFAALWERIHGDGAWARNDWVTATTFTVAMRNIDQ